MRLNVAIKIALLSRGQTQRGVSIVTGIPETRLSGIVRGHVKPTPVERKAIAEALQTSERALFGGVACRVRGRAAAKTRIGP